jgi:hypothetical protein
MVQGARSLKKKLVALAKSESRGQLTRNELTDAKKPNQAGIRSTVLPADLRATIRLEFCQIFGCPVF